MGLDQRDLRRFVASHLRRWALPGLIVIVATLLALSGDWGREWLRFDRDAIAGGEFWRLASGHFVHLGFSHWVLNGAGLLLVWFLVGEFLRTTQWLLVTVASIVGMDIGFWLLQPQLEWYVGLSGLLHGYLFAGIVAGYRERKVEMAVLGTLVVAKLIYEYLVGPLPGSELSTGGPVITAAHLYGAISGSIASSVMRIRVLRQSSI